jgi:hypothetical protein
VAPWRSCGNVIPSLVDLLEALVGSLLKELKEASIGG